MDRSAAVLLVLTLFVVSALAGGVSAGTPEPVTPADVSVAVHVERTNATAVRYDLAFDIPRRVDGYRVLLYNGRVTHAVGFDPDERGRSLEWDGSENASLTVTTDVRRAAMSRCTCVATDDWLLTAPLRLQSNIRQGDVQSPAYLTDWLSDSTVSTSVTVEDGIFLPGAVYFGPYSTAETTTRAGERIRVIEPSATADSDQTAHVLTTLRRASTALDVGPPVENVTILEVPHVADSRDDVYVNTMDVNGKAVNNGYLYVDGRVGMDTWVHEYVHTRQTFRTTREMQWFTEATAEYYGRYLAQGGNVSPYAVRTRFTDRPATGVLSDPNSWESVYVPYQKGGIVVAHLDRRIREETGGEHTFVDVFRRLNGREDLTVADLQRATAAVVGSHALDDEIERYVTTSATPTTGGEFGFVVGEADPSVRTGREGWRPAALVGGDGAFWTGAIVVAAAELLALIALYVGFRR